YSKAKPLTSARGRGFCFLKAPVCATPWASGCKHAKTQKHKNNQSTLQTTIKKSAVPALYKGLKVFYI
ncbi:MAG: hypothetical protein ACI4QS_05020, partial [Comamonas sp.]